MKLLKIVREQEFETKREWLMWVLLQAREQALNNPTTGSPVAIIAAYDALLAEITKESSEVSPIIKVA